MDLTSHTTQETPIVSDLSLPISKALKAILRDEMAFAVWRNPGQTAVSVIAQSNVKSQMKPDISQWKGFAFFPFDETQEGFCIAPESYYRFESGRKIHQQGIEIADFSAQDEIEPIDIKHNDFRSYFSPENTVKDDEEEDFCTMVSDAVSEIEAGNLQKVVLSRCKSLSLNSPIGLVTLFLQLAAKYPNAFISCVGIPDHGLWMGASPETLLQVRDKRFFHTVSLAGTQPVADTAAIQDIAWKHKEIEEQALVSRYIINCFKKIRLREYEENGPRTVRAGAMMHLKTDFNVDMHAVNFPELGSVMLELLHPTSAIAGMPRTESLAYIQANENYKRDFYAGYLGPVNLENQTHLFVNLRCMQLLESKALLYAGAGITADSDPEKEWQETEIKCNTMMSVIQALES